MKASLRAGLSIGVAAGWLGILAACGGAPEAIAPEGVGPDAGATAGATDAPKKKAEDATASLWSKPAFEVDSPTVQQGHWHHYGPFSVVGPYGTFEPVFEARLGPIGSDVDLYVRKGARPTLTAYDCRPYKGGTQVESCTTGYADSGYYYVSVYGYTTAKYGLRIFNNSNLGLSSISLQGETLAQGDWAFYGPFEIDSGTSSGAWLTPIAGDTDLYVNAVPWTETYYYGLYWPNESRYACRPYYGGTTAESCSTAAPSQQVVGVRGYSAGVSTYNIDIHQY
jgi:hypothetical protein